MTAAELSLWPSLLETTGKPLQADWDDVLRRLSRWREFKGEQSHPGWSAAVFEPCKRELANVKSITALVLDYDKGGTIAEAEKVWEKYYGLIHTTRRHSPDEHRFRVVLPLSRPVTPEEYAKVWREAAKIAGGVVDPQPKDPSRFWFLPGSADRDSFIAVHLTGQYLEPDRLLAIPEPKPAPIPEPPRVANDNDAEKRASAYLAKMPASISGSGGHAALWNAALAMVQGFGLPSHSALRLIRQEFNPRCQPAWSDRELEHKVADAASKSKLPNGYKLDERRDFETFVATRAPESKPPAEIRSVRELLDAVVTKAESSTPQRGVPCGHGFLDNAIGGFRHGHVTVLGATTSWGKSSFAVMTANQAMKMQCSVLLVSGEDTEATFGARIMAARARISALSLRDCSTSAEEKKRMRLALDSAETEPFFLNGIGRTAEELANVITETSKTLPFDLIIVDYLQAFTCAAKKQDRRNEITHIARTFVDAIKNSGSAGLIFSQLKRLAPDAEPTMHDLKESGDIENMAEHVLIGFGKKAEDEQANQVDCYRRYVTVEKNKDGPKLLTPIRMPFDLFTASFTPISAKEYEQLQDEERFPRGV